MFLFTFQNNACRIHTEVCLTPSTLKKCRLFYLQTQVEHITQKPRVKKKKIYIFIYFKIHNLVFFS